MRYIWAQIVTLTISSLAYSQCDSTALPVQNPENALPNISAFLNGYQDGFYQFQGNTNASTGLVLSYWEAEKVTFPDLPSYQSKSDGSTVGYSLNGCQALDSVGTGIHCMYLDYKTKDCPAGYELDFLSGQCELTDLQVCLDSQTLVCADGFDSDVLGYNDYCDRSPLKQCGDGSYVRADTGICPTECTDYLSCYDHALSNSSCESAQYFEFNYVDPENWEFSCTQIAEGSPDHPDNGGDGDGNPYNDPTTPDTGDGSTPDSSSIDPYSLAALIGDEIRPDLSSIERSVRDVLDQSKTNTGTLENAINDVEIAVRESTQSAENNANTITNSIDPLGTKLDGIDQSLNSGPCDPSQANYYQCLDTPLDNLPSHSTTGNVSTIEEANANFKARIESAALIQSFSGMSSLVDLDNAECPDFSIDLRNTPINEIVSTTIHCQLMDTIRPLLSTVMIIVYVWAGFRIFASA